MLETARVLKEFYSGFGMKAYTNDSIPDNVTLPYITYRYADSDWDQSISHYCIIYMRTNLNGVLLEKAEEIKAAIGTGLLLPCKNGYLCLHYENAEIISTDDKDVKGVYINMQMDIFHS